MEVAVPPAVVLVAPDTKLVVFNGANQTLPSASFALTIVTAAEPGRIALAANTVV